MTAGYSGTPLAKKLGIVPGIVLAMIDDPGHFLHLAAPLPDGVIVRETARGKADVAVLFTRNEARLRARIGSLGRMIFPDGALWVSWPKRASGVPTDLTEDGVRDVALPLGMVDVKVAAIDETWSGLKLVWRRERRR